MRLAVRHRTALEPAVENLLDSAKHALAFLGGDRDFVDVLAVQVVDFFNARQLAQLLD